MKKFDLIYLIDDDVIFRSILKIYIQAHPGFEKFEEHENGKLAIDALKSAVEENKILPEIILLDLNMPTMDGWQFLDEYEKMPQSNNIPVVILSSSIDPEDLKKAKSYPIVKEFMKKPINIGFFDKIIDLVK